MHRWKFFSALHIVANRLIAYLRHIFPDHPYMAMSVIRSEAIGQIINQDSHQDLSQNDPGNFSIIVPLHEWVNLLVYTSPGDPDNPKSLKLNADTIFIFDKQLTHAGACNNCEATLYRLHFYVCKQREHIPENMVFNEI
jgi:hypothetical protein